MSGLEPDVLWQPAGSFAALAILATVELWARSLRRRRRGTPRDGFLRLAFAIAACALRTIAAGAMALCSGLVAAAEWSTRRARS